MLNEAALGCGDDGGIQSRLREPASVPDTSVAPSRQSVLFEPAGPRDPTVERPSPAPRTGDLARAFASAGTRRSRVATECIHRGESVPDRI